jgi:murein L,D-transpeptidase YcbB/YkuD
MMTRAAAAAALLCGTPFFAAGPAVAAGTSASALALEPAVQAFYESRGNAPLWIAQPGASEALISVLQRSALDGFASGPQFAAAAQSALERAAAGDATAREEADRLLSVAWVRYVRGLRTPPTGMVFADRSLLAPQSDGRSLLMEAASAGSLANHVRRIASVNPAYSALRDAAWAEMQATGASPDRKVLSNLDRARFMPRAERYLIVDAASARLMMIEHGQVRDSMKVIVGKGSSQTPMLASKIHYATLNPYWNVPTDLTRKLIAPRVLQEGMGYLKERGYEVLAGYDENAPVIDPDSVDWKAVANGSLELRVRQRPGPGNSMGKVKFSFQNNQGIYLHDTPNKELFAQSNRDLSNGCIRVEDADRLGHWLLGRAPAAALAPEQHIALHKGVPVYVTYLTAQPQDRGLAFLPDVYGRDRSGGATLAASR